MLNLLERAQPVGASLLAMAVVQTNVLVVLAQSLAGKLPQGSGAAIRPSVSSPAFDFDHRRH